MLFPNLHTVFHQATILGNEFWAETDLLFTFVFLAYFPILKKNRLGLRDPVAVRAYVFLCVCPPIVARQRLGKSPFVVARQRLRFLCGPYSDYFFPELLVISVLIIFGHRSLRKYFISKRRFIII
jgi:hypothetical protein